MDTGLNTSTCDFGIQVPEFETDTCDFGVQVPEFKNRTCEFGVQVFGEFECEQCKQKTFKIQQLQIQLENQWRELVELSERLTKANEYIIKINEQYQRQCKQNKILIQKWDSRYSNQQK